MKPGVIPGARLSASDIEQIRAEVMAHAARTGYRAYTLRYDGDELVEFRGWPSGELLRSRVERDGLSLEPPAPVEVPKTRSERIRESLVPGAAMLASLVAVAEALIIFL